MSKTWVKAGTFNVGNRTEDTSDKGKIVQTSYNEVTDELVNELSDQKYALNYSFIHLY